MLDTTTNATSWPMDQLRDNPAAQALYNAQYRTFYAWLESNTGDDIPARRAAYARYQDALEEKVRAAHALGDRFLVHALMLAADHQAYETFQGALAALAGS